MTKRVKQIPRFATEGEEREYWQTHDFAEHLDLSQAQPAIFPNLQPTTTAISLRLPAMLLAELKVVANKRGVPYQSLMKLFLAERLAKERLL